MLASFVSAAGAIPTIPVGTAGQRMPLISLGTGSGQHGDVENATAMWLQVGGSGIDTAYIYEDEAPIAAGVKAVGASWGSIFLTTKIPCATTHAATANVASNLRSPMSKTSWLRLRPADGLLASPSAKSHLRLPQAPVSLGQSASWSALLTPCCLVFTPLTRGDQRGIAWTLPFAPTASCKMEEAISVS